MKRVCKKWLERLRAVRQRTWVKVFVLLCVIWVCWYPKRMDALFMSIPAGSTIASYHNGAAAEWKGLVNNAQIIGVLDRFNVKNAQELKDNIGVYQTIFWLTGRHTVLGYVPEPSAVTHVDDMLDGYLAGASYVGWKAKILELLWRIKWVPGLGRLHVTPSGTRYLTFKVDEAIGGFLFMGLDIVDGILLASFSYNPEDVLVLVDRLRRFGPLDVPAQVFGANPPWQSLGAAKHTFWFKDERLPSICDGLNIEVSSFRKGSIDLHARTQTHVPELTAMRPLSEFSGSSLAGADLPASAAGAFFAGDTRLASLAGEAVSVPVGDGVLVGSLTAAPFEGRLLGLAYPGLVLAMPWSSDVEFGAWTTERSMVFGRHRGTAAIRTVHRTEDGASTLYVFPSALEVLGRVSTRDMAFAEQRAGMLRIGTHYGSYAKQRAYIIETKDQGGSIADAVTEWQRVYPDAFSVLRADLPAVANELKHLGAIAKMALPFLGDSDLSENVLAWVNIIDQLQALAPLGQVEAAVSVLETGGLALRLQAKALSAASDKLAGKRLSARRD